MHSGRHGMTDGGRGWIPVCTGMTDGGGGVGGGEVGGDGVVVVGDVEEGFVGEVAAVFG